MFMYPHLDYLRPLGTLKPITGVKLLDVLKSPASLKLRAPCNHIISLQ